MKVILTETQINRLLEQNTDLITTIKQMGFVPSGNSIFKHSQKPELTLTLVGDYVIVKDNGKEIAKIKTSEIEDLEGTIKSTSLKEQVIQGDKGDPYDYKKENGMYYAKKRSSQSWIKTSGNVEKAIASKIFKDSVKRPTTQTATDSTKKNVVPKKGSTNVLVSDTLVNKKIVFDPSNETTPFICSEEGCAEFVSNQLSDLGVQRQGNAWHSHNINQKGLEKSPFLKLSPDVQNQMAVLFSNINANPQEKSQESNAKRLVNTLIPQQQIFKNSLSVNDIVGLYYDDSTNFTKAFFEGATGMSDMGSGTKVTDGPYFRRADNGKPWSTEDLGKKIKFVPGNSLKNGSGFGLNTHLGYVGAKVDGEPIIFHNVHGQVYATPLNKMSKTKVLWVKSGPGEVIKPKETVPSYWESFTSLFS